MAGELIQELIPRYRATVYMSWLTDWHKAWQAVIWDYANHTGIVWSCDHEHKTQEAAERYCLPKARRMISG